MYKLIKEEYKNHKNLKYLIIVCAFLICAFRLCLWLGYRAEDYAGSGVIERSVHEPSRSKRNIFFVATSCEDGGTVAPRGACGVESAALANPRGRVYLLHTCASLDRFALPEHLVRLLLLPNVRFLRLDVARFVRGSPAEGAIARGRDALAMVALWKYGGTYVGEDFVVFKAFDGLSNFAGAETDRRLADGIVNFEPYGLGHDLATECLAEMMKGPTAGNRSVTWAVTRVLQRRCGVSEVPEMTRERCGGFYVLPPVSSDEGHATLLQAAQSYALAARVWTQRGEGSAPLLVGSNSTHARLAERYCPAVYRHCGAWF